MSQRPSALLERLRDAVGAVVEHTTALTIANEDSPLCVALLECLASCLEHGLRESAVSQWPLWRVLNDLGRSEDTAADRGGGSSGTLHSVAAARGCRRVHTDGGRVGAWLRASLNSHELRSYVRHLLSPAYMPLRLAAYTDAALVRDPDAAERFQTLVDATGGERALRPLDPP